MFRGAVLAIVLMFAAGANVVLYCQAFCDATAAAASGCHHHPSDSPRIASHTDCRDAVHAVVALKEEPRRADSPTRVVVLASFHALVAAAPTSLPDVTDGGWPIFGPRLNAPLRI